MGMGSLRVAACGWLFTHTLLHAWACGPRSSVVLLAQAAAPADTDFAACGLAVSMDGSRLAVLGANRQVSWADAWPRLSKIFSAASAG